MNAINHNFNSQATRMVEGAKRFAAADKSDPFTLARCLTHTLNGLASVHKKDGKTVDHFYDAEEYKEKRTLDDGTEFFVPAFKNAKRP